MASNLVRTQQRRSRVAGRPAHSLLEAVSGIRGLDEITDEGGISVLPITSLGLDGRYQLEVYDIYQMPALAKDHQIIAAPTLVKVLPAPLRRFVGDLSRSDRVLLGLDRREKP